MHWDTVAQDSLQLVHLEKCSSDPSKRKTGPLVSAPCVFLGTKGLTEHGEVHGTGPYALQTTTAQVLHRNLTIV